MSSKRLLKPSSLGESEIAEGFKNLEKEDVILFTKAVQEYMFFAAGRLLKQELRDIGDIFFAMANREKSSIPRKSGGITTWGGRWQAWGKVAAVVRLQTGDILVQSYEEHAHVPASWKMPIFDSYLAKALAELDGDWGFEKRDEGVFLSKVVDARLEAQKAQEAAIAEAILTAEEAGIAEAIVLSSKPYDEAAIKLRTNCPKPFMYSPYGNDASGDDKVDASSFSAEFKEQVSKYKENPMDKTVRFVTDLKSAAASATKRQAGRVALAVIHSAVFQKLPIKWSFWAKITGKRQKIIDSPYTKLATAAAAHGLASAYDPNSKLTYVTKGALQFALDDAIDKGIDVENMVEKALGVDKTMLEELYKKFDEKAE